MLGTIRVLEAAREHGAQVVFSSTGGAIYGECDEPATEDEERAAALAVRRRRSWPARSTWRPTTGSTGRGTCRCASATSTGRGRTRTARPASSRSSSAGCGRRDAADLRRRRADARLRLRRRRRARDVGRGRSATAASTTWAPGARPRSSSCSSSAAAWPGRTSSRSSRRARPGELQRSVLDPGRAVDELGWRPERSLEDGPARDLGVVHRLAGVGRTGANSLAPWRFRPQLFALFPPTVGGPRPSLRAASRSSSS